MCLFIATSCHSASLLSMICQQQWWQQRCRRLILNLPCCRVASHRKEVDLLILNKTGILWLRLPPCDRTCARVWCVKQRVACAASRTVWMVSVAIRGIRRGRRRKNNNQNDENSKSAQTGKPLRAADIFNSKKINSLRSKGDGKEAPENSGGLCGNNQVGVTAAV